MWNIFDGCGNHVSPVLFCQVTMILLLSYHFHKLPFRAMSLSFKHSSLVQSGSTVADDSHHVYRGRRLDVLLKASTWSQLQSNPVLCGSRATILMTEPSPPITVTLANG
ncbi:hypothetical protein EVAR_83401_1 [Eumeta japonica]|uniref:Uncharacterized protein n=1 Tax=Eumeta variegata TaxID=151549 RepID=A0A4C1TYT2_EUMVA|nr:hypothetical protein EVAR_83401_1 [Eumeta japonica]